MTFNKLEFNIMKWLYIITPIVLMYFSSLIYEAKATQDKIIATKADKVIVDNVCTEIKSKVDNETLIQMLEVLKARYNAIEKVNDEQTRRLDYQRDIQAKQLEALRSIEIEIIKMNKRGR